MKRKRLSEAGGRIGILAFQPEACCLGLAISCPGARVERRPESRLCTGP
jgi:hypothetical protein